MVIQVQADLAPSLRGYSSLYEEFIMIWFRSCSGVFGINLQRLISAQRFKTMFTDYWNSLCLPHVGHTTRWHTREQCKTHSSKEFSFFFRRKLNYSFTHSISKYIFSIYYVPSAEYTDRKITASGLTELVVQRGRRRENQWSSHVRWRSWCEHIPSATDKGGQDLRKHCWVSGPLLSVRVTKIKRRRTKAYCCVTSAVADATLAQGRVPGPKRADALGCCQDVQIHLKYLHLQV